MSGEPDPFVFDDDFVKAASFTEPSARERAKRPGRLTRWRTARAGRRKARRDRRAMGRYAGAAAYRPRSRLRAAGSVIAVLAVMALLGGLGWTLHHVLHLSPRTERAGRGAAPMVRATDPFAGSPAASYADGADGITPPAAAATGPFGARDVTSAYADARRRLIAAALDRQTLLGGNPDAFARAAGPDERAYFVRNLNNPDVDKRTRWQVVTFAPNTAVLHGTVIKVHGTMSAHPSAANGVRGVGVRFDYLFVYPIQRPGAPSSLERLVARITGEVFYYRRDGRPHAHTADWSIVPTPSRCDVRDGFIHPAYDDSAPERSPGTGPERDPYDQFRPEPTDRRCHRSKRT